MYKPSRVETAYFIWGLTPTPLPGERGRTEGLLAKGDLLVSGSVYSISKPHVFPLSTAGTPFVIHTGAGFPLR